MWSRYNFNQTAGIVYKEKKKTKKKQKKTTPPIHITEKGYGTTTSTKLPLQNSQAHTGDSSRIIIRAAS